MADDESNLLANQSVTGGDRSSSIRRPSIPKDAEKKKDMVDAAKIEPKEASKMIGEVMETDPARDRLVPKEFRVYRLRWLVLAVVALLNNSNTMSWIAFASISNYVDVFYGTAKAANWFSLIYILCTIPVGIFAMWMGSSFGLRTAILIAAWANALGGTIRLISSFLPIDYRFPVGICGQALAACAYPFIMFLPPKVAGSWFAENQRALATTIGIMANPLGVLIANLVSPQIVSQPADVPKVNIFTFVPSSIACLLATIWIRRSEPETPPSRSASVEQMPFIQGIKKCFTNMAYIILLIVMGGGIGMFNCLYTIIQQLLCAVGYSNFFSGLCAALMIVGGVCGATSAGIFVDRTKLYEETMKVCMSLAVICGIVFLEFALHPNLSVGLAMTAFCFGVLGLASYPVGLEMATECTFPVSVTTSTGLIVISGQIQSIAYVAFMSLTARPLNEAYMKIQVCTVGDSKDSMTSQPQDSTYSVITISAIASALAVILVIFFKPTYKRLQMEQGKGAQKDSGYKAKALEGQQLDDMRKQKDEGTVPLAHAEIA